MLLLFALLPLCGAFNLNIKCFTLENSSTLGVSFDNKNVGDVANWYIDQEIISVNITAGVIVNHYRFITTIDDKISLYVILPYTWTNITVTFYINDQCEAYTISSDQCPPFDNIFIIIKTIVIIISVITAILFILIILHLCDCKKIHPYMHFV
jgi:hypothetical protein